MPQCAALCRTVPPARIGAQVGAPEGMVEWLAPDRCMVTLSSAAEVKRRGKALQAFVRAWILHV